MDILTHRGLDNGKSEYFPESSRDAFVDQLSRGYGLEFDIFFTKDDQILVSHNPQIDPTTPYLVSFPELLSLIQNSKAKISALHLKHYVQKFEYLDRILIELEKINLDKILVFDVTLQTAKYIKSKNKKIQLAPSVSHEFDIERFSKTVGGTLMTIDEVLKNRNLFDWVWLDEWDRSLPNGGNKTLYNTENFELFRKNGFKVALVTPELHSTSPGLLGGELHQDALNIETLADRFKEIILLKPDVLCTDWPDLVRKIVI